MKKKQLVEHIAKTAGITRADAADQLDQIVIQILDNLRKGKTANVPGLGTVRAAKPRSSQRAEK